MNFYLCRNAYFCAMDEGAVFLELQSGRYSGMKLDDFNAVKHLIHGLDVETRQSNRGIEVSPDQVREVIQVLRGANLITENQSMGKRAKAASIGIDGQFQLDLQDAKPCVRWDCFYHFLASYMHTRLLLKRRRLRQAIDELEAFRERQLAGIDQDRIVAVEGLTASFMHFRPWIYSPRNACLLDSLTLCRFLRRYDIASRLVIGVCTKPFSAHAWVQFGNLVLNDTVERVRSYTPILVS